MRHGALGSVVRVGLIAGTLDITENLIFNAFRHITPVGVAIHYTIAFFWTAVYWVASRRMGVLIGRPVVCGLVYGAVVYLIMNFVVLPLTRVPHSRTATTVASRVSGVLALLFCSE
jgi:hypothetical protein